MKKPHTIIAETMGTTGADILDYQYHNFRDEDPRAFFWIGSGVYCIGQTKPELDGLEFHALPDQHFAKLQNTILWIGKEVQA